MGTGAGRWTGSWSMDRELVDGPGASVAVGRRVPSRDMGRRERARLRAWAEEMIARHGIDVARIVGLDPPLPEVDLKVVPQGGGAAWTNGLRITMNERWFAEHPDDAGCILHALAHAHMRAPLHD